MAGTNNGDESPRGRDRRTHVRQPLEVVAEVSAGGSEGRSGRILDFCPGGLFVSIDGLEGEYLALGGRQLVRDDPVEVRFRLLLQGRPQAFALGGRLARILDGGLGVAFVHPDPRALEALQGAVARAPRRVAVARVASGPEAIRAVDALDACSKAIRRFLETSGPSLFQRAHNVAVLAARAARNNAEENEHAEALREIHALHRPVLEGFIGAVLEGFSRVYGGASTRREVSLQDMDSGSLALVDTSTFDDWLTTKNIIGRAEAGLRGRRYELDGRLQQILGRELDEAENPLSPQEVCFAFHGVMQNLGAGKLARRAIYQGFEDAVVDDLGELYDDLNRVLVDAGILPRIAPPKPVVAKPSRAEPPPQAAPDLPESRHDPDGPPAAPRPDAGAGGGPRWPRFFQADPEDALPLGSPAAPGQAVQGGPSGSPVVYPDSGRLPSATMPEGLAGAGSAPDWRAAPASALGPTPRAAAPVVTGSPAPAAQQLAQVGLAEASRAARSIVYLRRQLLAGAGAASAAGSSVAGATALPTGTEVPVSPTTGDGAGAPSDVDGFIETLSRLQALPPTGGPREGAGSDLKTRLRAAAEAEGLVMDAASQEAVEVISDLFESILLDRLVSTQVKSRLHRLAMPLLKVALQDQDFYARASHPARQVVDRLGRLDLPEEASRGGAAESLRADVDPLVERIVSDSRRDSAVFAEVLPALDELLFRQSARYSENLERLLAGWKAMAASPMPSAPPPADLGPWVARARRLRVGDAVVLDANSENPRRATLAWVSEDGRRSVLVDAEGREAAALDQATLARGLRAGSVRRLEGAGLEVVDRGLYGMVGQMHRQLVADAARDPLTGLLRRAGLEARLEESLEASMADGSTHMLAYLDLDGYGRLVSECGPKAGRSLLAKLGPVLTRQVGDRGAVARLPGDVFGLLLTDCPFEEAEGLLGRIRRAVEKSRVVYRGREFDLSLSIGLVPVNRDTESTKSALRAAEIACRVAKAGGGNRLEVCEPPDGDFLGVPPARPPVSLRVLIGDEGLEALRSPLVALEADGADRASIHRVAAALRGDGPMEARTAELLRGAEQLGERPLLDRWVLDAALDWMAGHRRELPRIGGLLVPLAPATVADEGFLGHVVARLSETRVPPAKLILELPAEAATDGLSPAAGLIRGLSEYGARFGVSGFGTGEANPGLLKSLPVELVRIAPGVFRGIAAGADQEAVARSLQELARLLGKRTLAGPVDDEATLTRLREVGVDLAEGPAVAAMAAL